MSSMQYALMCYDLQLILAYMTQDPAYTSSIQVKDQDREARGERHEERGEATQVASLAKIDLPQAMSAALAQVPGTGVPCRARQ